MENDFFPQQPERLGVLPIMLRGGLGQPPETLHQVPRGSEGMEPVRKWRFHSWNVRFREVPKWRFPSWNVRFREVPKWRFHSWNVRFREVPKWRFHSWNVGFREVPKWRFHSWNVRFREVPKWRFHSWNVRSFFEMWYVFAYNMFCVSHSMFSVTHNMSKRKTVPVHQLLGFSHGLIWKNGRFGANLGKKWRCVFWFQVSSHVSRRTWRRGWEVEFGRDIRWVEAPLFTSALAVGQKYLKKQFGKRKNRHK